MMHKAHYETPIEGEWEDLGEAEMQPPVWVIKNMLPAGIVFLAGPPKSMKSTIEMALACAVAGVHTDVLPPDLREVEKSGCVMGLSAEATAGELRHMVESGMRAKVPDNRRILIASNPWDFRLDDDDALQRLLHWLQERKPRLFFVDPLRDFHSLEERDDGGMNRLLRPIQKWAKEHDACFMVVHHTKKKNVRQDGDYDAGDMRGTGALFGIADGLIMLTPRPEGVVHFSTIFKRAQGWERDIKLGTWGARVSGGGADVITQLDKDVWKALKKGAMDMMSIAQQLGKSKTAVVTSVNKLVLLGALARSGRKVKVTAQGAVLVSDVKPK